MTVPENGSRTHEPSLRELCAELDGFRALMDERDKRYEERDRANKEAVRSALNAAEKATQKTEENLKEYKVGANEWRGTVADAMAGRKGKMEQMNWIVTLAAAAIGYFVHGLWK